MSICHLENPHKTFFFALLLFQSAHVKVIPHYHCQGYTSLSLSYLALALLVFPSALKGQSKSVSKASPKLGSGALRHFYPWQPSKAQKPPSATDQSWQTSHSANKIDNSPKSRHLHTPKSQQCIDHSLKLNLGVLQCIMDFKKAGNMSSSQEKILESTFRRTAASQCKHEPEIHLQGKELLIKTLQLPFSMKSQ